MATNVVAWMQQANAYFPNDSTLLNEWTRDGEISEEFLHFDDNFFWKALRDMVENPVACFSQKEIVDFCKLLLSNRGLEMLEGSEIRFESDDANAAQERFKKMSFYSDPTGEDVNIVTLFSSVGFTKHVPEEEFEKALKDEDERTLLSDRDDPEYNEEESKRLLEIKKKDQRMRRLMDGTVIEREDGSLALLCDDDSSLMKYLYKVKLYIVRQYKIDSHHAGLDHS